MPPAGPIFFLAPATFGHPAGGARSHQPIVPGSPLNGPTTRGVIHPP